MRFETRRTSRSVARAQENALESVERSSSSSSSQDGDNDKHDDDDAARSLFRRQQRLDPSRLLTRRTSTQGRELQLPEPRFCPYSTTGRGEGSQVQLHLIDQLPLLRPRPSPRALPTPCHHTSSTTVRAQVGCVLAERPGARGRGGGAEGVSGGRSVLGGTTAVAFFQSGRVGRGQVGQDHLSCCHVRKGRRGYEVSFGARWIDCTDQEGADSSSSQRAAPHFDPRDDPGPHPHRQAPLSPLSRSPSLGPQHSVRTNFLQPTSLDSSPPVRALQLRLS